MDMSDQPDFGNMNQQQNYQMQQQVQAQETTTIEPQVVQMET